jgi:Holliday junction resolvase
MTNYSRGRAREYKTMQLLRTRGYVCSRSAMSHGPVDIFAAKAGRILLIQVKSGSSRVKKHELKLLKKWAAAFDAEAQVWSFKKHGELVKVTVKAGLTPRGTSKSDAKTLSRPPVKTEEIARSTAILIKAEAVHGSAVVEAQQEEAELVTTFSAHSEDVP